jgi:hypothetical protein
MMSVLLILASFAVAHAASIDSSHTLMAIDVCGCCPRTCGGGTLIGCYNTIDMPPNAVTCVYRDAAGNAFECVSCLHKANEIADALNAIFEPGPAVATVAQ